MNRFTQFFAGGQWHASSGAELVGVFNPATEEQFGMLRRCSPHDVDRAVRAAAHAFPSWSVSNLVQRRDALARLAKAIEVREQSFIASFALEAGCPPATGRVLQGQWPRHSFAATLRGLDQVLWREAVDHALVLRVPLGVVAGICAWNTPLFQMVSKTAAAIAAGSSIVLKPSELTPGTVRLFCEAVEECDLPPGLVNVLSGGAAVGAALAAHPEVGLISFTGSRAVGQQVGGMAAQHLKPARLHLGGKSPAVLLDDADLDLALPAVLRSCLAHSGQNCAAQARLLVARPLRDEVAARLPGLVREWVVGPPQAEATRLGPLATAAQFNRVNAIIEQALADGAQLLAGGPGRAPGLAHGHYIAPTILGVTPRQSVTDAEIFGPVLCVLDFDTDADAVHIANSTACGLSAAVWSGSAARAQAVALRLRAGEVGINGARQGLAATTGGSGASGHAREIGRCGIEALLDSKTIHVAD